MNSNETGRHRKPLLSALSLACAALALPVARLGATRLGSAEDLLGYGALGVALTLLVVMLGIGLAAALLALARREQPLTLVVSAILLNAAALAWVLVSAPG